MDAKSKRQLLDELRSIIGGGYEGTQSDICDTLSAKGFDVTQSTISRCMKQLGVIKDGSRYELKQTNATLSFSGSIGGLVRKLDHNETMIVARTGPGSASFVAGYLDHNCQKDILGTTAGDDTILIIPRSTKNIKQHFQSIESFLANST